jgi:hypothetical protein
VKLLGVIRLAVGLALVLCSRQVGLSIPKAQNYLWGLHYENETPNRVASVLVGAVFVLLGVLALPGVTHLR